MTSTTATRRKTPLWAKILLVVLVLLLIAGAAVAGIVAGKYFGAREERDIQVVRSVQLEEKVILLSAGLSDIKEERDNQDFFGLFDIPLSERAMFIRYDYDAKFGIDGKDVHIEPKGDNAWRVTIPKFIALGYENPNFTVATESNGLLSWTTPEIDKLKAAKEVLTDEAVAKHIEGFRPLLEVQARTFYTNILTAIDPDITLEFEFAQ